MKLTFKDKPGYAEEGQPNSIRWAILSGTPDNLTNETSWLKCKDFFNDYIVAYNGGTRFNIYGFSTQNMTIPEKGKPVYMGVTYLTKKFLHNLEHFNFWCQNNDVPTTEWESPSAGVQVLTVSPFFLKSTYNISLWSLIVRLCNDEKEFASFEDICAYKGFAPKDQQKWDQVVAKKVFFSIPEKLKKFTWYCDGKHNSDNPPAVYQLPSLVHNCGCLSYMRNF